MKIFSLTYNELIKQFKKPSIKIIFSLILTSAIILPMIINKIPVGRESQNALESNKFMLNQEIQNVENYKDDRTQKGKIEYEYALIKKDYMQMLVDYKIGFEDWRAEEVDYYISASYNLAAIQFVLEGYEQSVVKENLRSTDPKKVDSYYDDKITLAKKKEIESYYITEKEKHKKILEEGDYQGYTKERINKQNEFIDHSKKQIEEYEKLKAKNIETDYEKAELAKLEKAANSAKKIISTIEQEIKVIEFRLNNKIDYDLNNWKNNSLKTIEKEMQELRLELISEKDYSATANQQGYSMTYDEYVKSYNEKKAQRIDKIKQLWYGLENNIPALDDVRDARSILDSTYEIYIILGIIVVIIIGGGILATEFSKGTIRLLLIRPVSRWKILLSKLLSILFIGFSIVVFGIGVLYISTGAVFGFDSYKTPLLETINGNIVQVEFIKYLLPKILISSSSVVFISSLVFMISTLTKNTALSVAMTMLFYLGVAPVTDLLVKIKQVWIMNTLIPYVNASYFRLVPMTSQTLSKSFGIQMNYVAGSTQLLIASLFMLIIIFIVFIKSDIKN